MNYTFKDITYDADLHRERMFKSGLTWYVDTMRLESPTQDIEIPITHEEFEELTETPHFLVRAFIRERLAAGKCKTIIHQI